MIVTQPLISIILLLALSVEAFPFISINKRQSSANNGTIQPANGTGNTTNGTSPTTGGGSATNGTSPTTGGGGGTGQTGQLQIFITGGEVPITSNYSTTTIFNNTGILNLTQLYQVGSTVNSSLGSDQTKGIVIIASKKSFESLSFFSSIVFDTNKTIVITDDIFLGIAVANDQGAGGRGPLVVGKNKVIYAGSLPPFGVPVGVIGDNLEPYWFFTAQQTTLFLSNSTLRTNFSNFTTTNSSSQVSVPIVYEEGISGGISNTFSSSTQISGLVVISSGSLNSTSSSNSSSSSSSPNFPVVFTNPGNKISYLSEKGIPSNAIPGGYLTPVQAQILLAVAVSNGVTSTDSLKTLFP